MHTIFEYTDRCIKDISTVTNIYGQIHNIPICIPICNKIHNIKLKCTTNFEFSR